MLYYIIFQQLFKFIPRYRFDKKVEETSGNHYCKHFSAWRQFLTCLYAQITGKDSLREIASGLMWPDGFDLEEADKKLVEYDAWYKKTKRQRKS